MAEAVLEIFQGTTVKLDVAITVDGETAADLTGCKLWFTAKERRSDDDADAILQKTSDIGGGITILDAPGGLARIALTPAESALFSSARLYFYDVQIKTPTGDIYRPSGLYGTLRATPRVTAATS